MLRFLLWALSRWYNRDGKLSKRLNDKERLVAYKDVYEVQNFQDVLREHIERWVKYVAFRSVDDQQLWFYRGSIYGHQMLMQNLKKYHEAWLKEKEKYGSKVE